MFIDLQGFIQWGGGGGGGGGGGQGEASPPNSLASPSKNLTLIKHNITVNHQIKSLAFVFDQKLSKTIWKN